MKEEALAGPKDAALKLALEALNWSKPHEGAVITHGEAIDAIIEALLQATSGDYALGYAEGFNDACKPKPAQKPEGKQFQAKFNIEDRVWYLKNNKPTEVIISAIEIFFVNTNQDQITYNAKNVDHSVSWLDHTKLKETWLFKSKTELLEAL